MNAMTHAPGGDTPVKAWARALTLTAPIGRNPSMTLPVLIGELAGAFGDRIALIGDDETMSYAQLARRSNRYARWAVDQGLAQGDVVCLMMHNCPEYLAAWLGITRVGAVVALINTNLVRDSLAHAIRVATPRCMIVGADLAAVVAGIMPILQEEIPCWAQGAEVPGMRCLDAALEMHSTASVNAEECAPPLTTDRALYIYTSGTTGLPKAAVIRHHRVLQWSYWFAGLMAINETDRMYDCLPMYHSVGGIAAIGSTLVSGGSVVLRRKFSAAGFWEDVARTECTLFQYIGELCRFLVNAPPNRFERDHRIRIACGNGLRPDIWESFQSRFAIPKILEFYAATEGNFSLYNCEGKAGAIGRIPPYLAHRFPIALVAVDAETGEPIRDERGQCRRCVVDEVGEALGRIASDGLAGESAFDGYTDRCASERKILCNVLSEGDAWFRSGDLLRRDAAGFFYFVDRIGDTFRWRGENVSTAEVADAVCAWPAVREAVVYGVQAPGHDGRAGMVALVANGELDLAGFRAHLAERLPEFARPVFVRVLGEIETTGTFKPKKYDLACQGFDPRLTTDALFVNDRRAGAFVPVDVSVFETIRRGRMRL